jgi:hypothetical protein
VAGVVRAFENDNPLAYAALAREGLLGENLTTDQINTVKSAKAAFENRRRSEYNESLFTAEQDLMTRVENGALSPMEAVEAQAQLYAEHNITMNAQDAGQIYTDAESGVMTSTATRGVLIDEALLRGDYDTAADVMIEGLIGTESSGRADAFRVNEDGRQFGGLVQMGQARLDDWSAANGTPRITPRQYASMSPAQQKAIARWHVKDNIQWIQKNYGDKIGTKVGGVTVTLAGLNAVKHLSGPGGVEALFKGDYRKDELGTTTLTYLKKHGAGMMDELFTPAQSC